MATNAQGSDEETSFLDDSPKVEWRPSTTLFHWKGFWLMPDLIKSIMIIEKQFKPLPSDILLASYPKTGTTWLKALFISILSHNSKAWISPDDDAQADLLQTHNLHELIPFLEMETFGENWSQNINKVPSPWVFSIHLPYSILIRTPLLLVIHQSRELHVFLMIMHQSRELHVFIHQVVVS
ncbi:Cytosolic sulfotransferase 14 [Camellia lanceoleosa]|uniref:Cytosolic sulfotransferase 14 n=1 Tax=Camellia lanceoleosa TaxID=1840588 RepID=A0ACC0J0C0_9ERIC|nr:Cytosolic sulfotransferase 14 [Camellia lanceoleosa]